MKSLIIAAAPFVVLSACSHAAPASMSPMPVAAVPAAITPTAPAATELAGEKVAVTCQGDTDCLGSRLCLNATCQEITASTAECGLVRVHFDFDKSDVHAADEPDLDRAARCLMASQKMHVLVTGNADERGTEEYNLALGDRRANAVAEYLEHRGVSATQLRTVSFGKDLPLCRQDNEACWSENRRSSIKLDELASGPQR